MAACGAAAGVATAPGCCCCCCCCCCCAPAAGPAWGWPAAAAGVLPFTAGCGAGAEGGPPGAPAAAPPPPACRASAACTALPSAAMPLPGPARAGAAALIAAFKLSGGLGSAARGAGSCGGMPWAPAGCCSCCRVATSLRGAPTIPAEPGCCCCSPPARPWFMNEASALLRGRAGETRRRARGSRRPPLWPLARCWSAKPEAELAASGAAAPSKAGSCWVLGAHARLLAALQSRLPAPPSASASFERPPAAFPGPAAPPRNPPTLCSSLQR